jgi:tripartite-type tricarboxylate transporter receptor subunit TctC
MLPNVPTIAELGIKDYEADLWFGLFAPAKTPNDTVAQLASWSSAALQEPEVSAKLASQGLYPANMCGKEFGNYLRKQYDDYGRIIREAGIKVE